MRAIRLKLIAPTALLLTIQQGKIYVSSLCTILCYVLRENDETSAISPADPVDGWEMTAIMAKELGAIEAYRTQDNKGFVYMVVNNARWVKAGQFVTPVGRL